ncbi:MAG: hypothetical protein KC646_16685 [Candidatus Cloacimonetes bacterium]|nr:hypothetical protein [Candidatus Cloacimonadota bacterium]
MKCENFISELYESSLSHLSEGLTKHLQGCASCEKEYLKIKRLESGFLNADKVTNKPSNMIRNFSVAMAVTCVLFFQGAFEKVEVQSSFFDTTEIALAHAIEETESLISDQIYDIDFTVESSFSEEYYFDEGNDFDVYDFAITTIENNVYNNTLEG